MQPVNTALCSFGMSSLFFHAPFIHAHTGFHLASVLERKANLAETKYPGVKTYRSLDQVLADPEVELVIVNTPNATHHEYAKKALLAGKHVVVEKPFTVSVAEAEELDNLAKSSGRVLAVYHNRRWDGDFLTVKKIVSQELLGELVEVEIHFDRFKTELSAKLHKETPGPGTGALYDLGSHLVDQALLLFGLPLSVYADIRILRPLSRIDDYFEVLLYYNNLRVRLKGTYIARETVPAYILHGTRGSFLKSRSDVQEAHLQAGLLPGKEDWGREPDFEKGILHTELDGSILRETVTGENGNYMEFYNQLYAAIRQGLPVPVSAADATNVIRVIDAAFKSNERRAAVDL